MPESEDTIVVTGRAINGFEEIDRLRRQELTLADDPGSDFLALIAALPDPFSEQDCTKVNLVNAGDVPDGSRYYSPKLSKTYLNDAIRHLQRVRDSNTINGGASLLLEFKAMYEDPAHPHFIDFKRWGPERGPAGSISGGRMTYVSEATGLPVNTSAFEPFGNYFFGLAGVAGGISPAVLRAGAGLMSQGSNWPADDPRDIPHVDKGIFDAQRWASSADHGSVVEIIVWNC